MMVMGKTLFVDTQSIPFFRMTFVCQTCGKEFKLKEHLTEHERKHKGTATYVCCGKSFFSQANWKRHQCSTHRAAKFFVCSTFQKAFAIKADLVRHKRREKGQISKTCDICGFKAEDISSMKDHVNKHTGEKSHRYTCCEYLMRKFPDQWTS